MNYSETQNAVLQKLNVQQSPSSLLDRWESFVLECETGYSWDYSEYLNELRVRDVLEELLAAPELSGFEEHDILRSNVEKLDKRLQRLFLPKEVGDPAEPWWRRRVLSQAGDAYAEYCRKVFGLDVEVI